MNISRVFQPSSAAGSVAVSLCAEQSAVSMQRARRALRTLCVGAVLAGTGLLPFAAHADEVAVPAAQEEMAAVSHAVAAVNINTASAEQLAAGLNGIGASRAEAIVRYREMYGPFESVDELAEVAGIGSATVERNRAMITLN